MAGAAPAEVEVNVQTLDLAVVLRLWEEQHTVSGYDPVPILSRLSDIFEEETDIYMRKDPDPFDERHPSRTDPDCELGRSLKLLFRKDHFMTRLVNDYLRENFFTRQNIQKSSLQLNIAACRLILVIMPGLETSAVFQTELDSLVIVHRLYAWAEKSEEPLQSYATGLLAAAMEVPDIAIGFREQNTRLIPLMIKRLHRIQSLTSQAKALAMNGNCSSAAMSPLREELAMADISDSSDTIPLKAEKMNTDKLLSPGLSRPFAHLGGGSAPSSPELKSPPVNGMSKFKNTINLNALFQSDTNQSESKYIRTHISIHPATPDVQQLLILRYLTSMGEYQEFLGQVFEHNAMRLIFRYIENLEQRDTCLAFESLKYLASLLCHKKFSLEFINNGGLERLMKVPKPSTAATGVSIALYYLAYCEDAMERICSMPQKFVSEVVNYALWLLGCFHDSGRCHATMFFGLAFQFKVVLDEFDSQDGLRKLYNVISVLPILGVDEHNLNDDEECSARQLVRHVCVSLKKYMESHLFYKYTQLSRINSPNTIQNGPAPTTFRAPKPTPEMIGEQVRTLQEMLPMRARWQPVEQILFLNGIPLLLRIIAYSYEWNYSGRAETVQSALDVLIVCCAITHVHLVFCERMDLPDEATAAGINIVLGAAEGEIVADAEVQKAALAVLVHCVCAPIYKPLSVGRYGSTKKKSITKHSEELINQIWESVRSNNGIIVLLQLMEIKTPITDADYIRGMACRALAGLARSETVRQIISKLPLFTNGQLQSLMRNPILQEKRTEHVQFQKYALELMERVSGKTKTENQLDASLANIHKANVVAQTKIQFNEHQLYELIHEHLLARGMAETASALKKEANLSAKCIPAPLKPISHHSPFSFRSPNTNLMASRVRIRSKQSDFNAMMQNAIDTQTTPTSSGVATATSAVAATTPSATPLQNHKTEIIDESPSTTANIPIKLIKKNHQTTTPNSNATTPSSHQRSLQKQISSVDPYTSTTSAPWSAANQSTINQHLTKNITLDTIITEYLTNQHALCKHPMSTCPQFDLFEPHKCPDPRPNKVYSAGLNFAGRFAKRQSGFNSFKLDRRLVHSQFCMARTIRAQDNDSFFTCCDFTPCASSLCIGSYNGDVKVFNINDSSEEFSHHCHDSYVNSVKCSIDGTLLITSGAWRKPLSVLWNIENRQFTQKLQWSDEDYLEFANTRDDRVLSTKDENATIYDLTTGKKTASFVPTIFNQYSKNRATFDPSDELILSDGVLWDVRSGKELHKFDKLNQSFSGVFHPNGLEIVSNTEVWDLRTFHLLRTVPALDQCSVVFSPQNVMYGFSPDQDNQMEFDSATNSFQSSFKTLDSYDYSSIVTVDVKRNIFDLSVNRYGSQIAIVENHGDFDSLQESAVRIYSVGRRKNVEDEAEDEDNDMDVSDDNSMNSMSDNDSVVLRNNPDRPNRRRRLRSSNDFPGDDNEWMPMSSSYSSTSYSDNDNDLNEDENVDNAADEDDNNAEDDDDDDDAAGEDDADAQNDTDNGDGDENNVADNNDAERIFWADATADDDEHDDGWVTDESD